MIKKLLIQAVFLIAMFISTWYILSQFDWIEILKVKKTEAKLGELTWKLFKNKDKEVNDLFVKATIDSIVNRICIKNNIDKNSIKIHVLEKDEINAVSLPDRHLIIYTGLLSASENPEELSGVICHELAHIELYHVTKKVTKEIGLSVVFSIAPGNVGADKIKQLAKVLSSSSFDRKLEKEADIKAIDYLAKANIDPVCLVRFFNKMSKIENDPASRYLSWINTHPDAKIRAKYVADQCKNKVFTSEQLTTVETWNTMRKRIDD